MNFTKTVILSVPPSRVWEALTDPEQMKQWMSQPDMEVQTTWAVGSPVNMQVPLYKKSFENKGVVLDFDRDHLLRYSHLSSISRLADVEENYTILSFRLSPADTGTLLEFTAGNFPTEVIYKHFAFYWNVTLEVLRKFLMEGGPPPTV